MSLLKKIQANTHAQPPIRLARPHTQLILQWASMLCKYFLPTLSFYLEMVGKFTIFYVQMHFFFFSLCSLFLFFVYL